MLSTKRMPFKSTMKGPATLVLSWPGVIALLSCRTEHSFASGVRSLDLCRCFFIVDKNWCCLFLSFLYGLNWHAWFWLLRGKWDEICDIKFPCCYYYLISWSTLLCLLSGYLPLGYMMTSLFIIISVDIKIIYNFTIIQMIGIKLLRCHRKWF